MPPRIRGPGREANEDAVPRETRLTVHGLPPEFDTQDLWDLFHKEGEIHSINIFKRDDGTLSGGASMYFGKVDASFQRKRVWSINIPRLGNKFLQLQLQFETPRNRLFVNPANNKQYPSRIELHARTVTFGVRRGPERAQSMATVFATDTIPVVLAQNPEQREITLTFPLQLEPKCLNQFKIRLTYTSSLSVWEIVQGANSGQRTLVLSIENVPELYVKCEESRSHTLGSSNWNMKHAWIRKTGVSNDPTALARLPISLAKRNSQIDIGLWRVYYITFDLSTSQSISNYNRFCQTLEDFNVKIQKQAGFELLSANVESIWNIIGGNTASQASTKPAGILAELGDFSTLHLPFRTRYQLEACISQGVLCELDIPREFVEKLRDLGSEKSVNILEHIAEDGKRVYDPLKFLNESLAGVTSALRKLPNSDFTYVYSAVITPTMIHYNAPMMEVSNRVLRRYPQHHDRFLRVKFEDERPRGKLFPGLVDERGGTKMDEVFSRIQSALENGIIIGDRHYEFLGFGSSQFREHGAYFFASLPHLSVREIRASMGTFKQIRSVSKYAARLGQCFSTTRPVRGARALVSEIPDIWTQDHRYIFTDGVGIISRCMAQLAASERGMALPFGEPPSVLQFRSGGAKGVLAVHQHPNNPKENQKPKIWIRPSQSKFHAEYELLEVVRWSQFAAAHLNRQLIVVLSDLGLSDEVFVEMMQQQLKSLNDAMKDPKTALRLLQKEVDQNQMTLVMASMVQDGFFASKEPFFMSLLHLWRAWCIKHLKDKAKIPVREGAVLLGCVDEFAVLQGHFNHKQSKSACPSTEERFDATPEIFVQLSEGSDRKPEVIEGYMLLTRNPALHPGDIRVVRGVNRPELHHLKDVVVLPQTGDRDLGNMCSGGDLDGDDYLVIWDQRLLPKDWNYSPMDYSALAELLLDREVTMQDIIGFFITYMKNDTIGTIANTHLATADREIQGVKSARCLELAQLHSRAVDYAKSGHAAKMPTRLQLQKWPHFMNRAKGKSYTSKKILGQLFDLVERVDFAPKYDNSFDSRILGKLSIPQETLDTATTLKEQYDVALHRIMMQFDIRTEFEVWSAFALQHIKRGSDFKMPEVLGEHTEALKGSFRSACCEAAGGRGFHHLAPFVCAMYEVTWRQVIEHAEGSEDDHFSGVDELPPFVSFPWIFHTELGRIANCDAADLQALGCVVLQNQPYPLGALLSEQNAAVQSEDKETSPLPERARSARSKDTAGLEQETSSDALPQENKIGESNPIHEAAEPPIAATEIIVEEGEATREEEVATMPATANVVEEEEASHAGELASMSATANVIEEEEEYPHQEEVTHALPQEDEAQTQVSTHMKEMDYKENEVPSKTTSSVAVCQLRPGSLLEQLASL